MASSSKNAENLERSVGVLYENLLRQRQQKQEEKLKRKADKQAETANPEADDVPTDDHPQLTKAEKKKKVEEEWRNLMANLTGDDLEYTKPKKKRKKYTKWICDDTSEVGLQKKPKKKKKTNYSKEFEQELGMLKQIVADQNRFTNDLTKRFQVMVGPAAKDAGPMSKTAVELASAVISSRANSLAIIREIGGLKKTVAQLTQKEKELEKKNNVETDSQDLALVGSSLARDIFGQGNLPSMSSVTSPLSASAPSVPNPQPSPQVATFEEFDPDAWTGSPTTQVDPHTKYEKVPTETVVELDSGSEQYRFKTIRTDTNEEIPDYPNPTFEITKIDKDNQLARDSFDTIYPLKIV